MELDPFPALDRQTDLTENITFPPPRYGEALNYTDLPTRDLYLHPKLHPTQPEKYEDKRSRRDSPPSPECHIWGHQQPSLPRLRL